MFHDVHSQLLNEMRLNLKDGKEGFGGLWKRERAVNRVENFEAIFIALVKLLDFLKATLSIMYPCLCRDNRRCSKVLINF